MTEATAIPTAEDLKMIVIAKSNDDAAFRQAVIDNPKAAVEKLFNVELPAHVSFNVVQEAADQYTIVLPHQQAVGAGGELSDNDLEAVAGGSKAGATKFFTQVGSGAAVGLGVLASAKADNAGSSLAYKAYDKCF
jgi:hypothetical protein